MNGTRQCPVTDGDARFFWHEYVECDPKDLTDGALRLRHKMLAAVRGAIAENALAIPTIDAKEPEAGCANEESQ